ncbi:hypothetical protein CLAIMM_01147 [Cladophialophora immunda]|nr:hypothetical protein CLAIMM_01147 [Cladophialophora immunda]
MSPCSCKENTFVGGFSPSFFYLDCLSKQSHLGHHRGSIVSMDKEQTTTADAPQFNHIENDGVPTETAPWTDDDPGKNEKSHVGTVIVDPGEDDKYQLTIGKFMGILAFCVGYLSDQFVVSCVGAGLADINKAIGPSPSYVWMSTGVPIGTAALAPVIGRFSDIYGRRNFILIGNAIGMIGTAVAATAHNVNTVIVGTVLVGISGAMRQLAWSAVGEIVPKKYRGLSFGIISTLFSLAPAFGPTITFAFTRDGTWRPIFWLPFALDAASLILTFFWYHPIDQYIHEAGKSTWSQLMETDFVGCFFFIAGLVLFLLGLSFGGNKYPWTSAGTLGPLIVGIVRLIFVGLYETYVQLKWPIFPPSIFRNVRGFTLILTAVFLYGMALYATAILWPRQVQILYSHDPAVVGWYSGANGFGGFFFSIPLAYCFLKLGHARWQLAFYVAGVTLIGGCQAIVSPSSNVASTVLAVLLFGCVTGVNIVSLTYIQVSVPHEFIGIATGLSVCFRTVGGAVGTVVFTTILSNVLSKRMVPDIVAPLAKAGVALKSIPEVIAALVAGNIKDSGIQLTQSQLATAVKGLQDAYTSSFRTVYLSSIAFGGVALVAVCFAADIDHLMTKKVEIRLEEGARVHAHSDTGRGHIIQQHERSA